MNKYNNIRIFLIIVLMGMVSCYFISSDLVKEITVGVLIVLFGFIINEIVFHTNKHKYERNKMGLFKLFPRIFIPKNKYITNHKSIIRIKKYFRTVKEKEVNGKYGEALRYLRAGLKVISEPVLVESLSMLLYSNGEIHKAIENLKAMKVTEAEAEKQKNILLSVCYRKIEDYPRALQCLTRVSELIHDEKKEKVRNLSDIAECYYKLEKKTNASPNIREAYRIAKKNNYTEGKLYIHRILLNYYYSQGMIENIAKVLTSTYTLLENFDVSNFDSYGKLSVNSIFQFERKLVSELLTNETIRRSILDNEFSDQVLADLEIYFKYREENHEQTKEAFRDDVKSTVLTNLDQLDSGRNPPIAS